jgi:hypothetical protein
MNYEHIWLVGRFAGNLAEYRQAFHDGAGEYNEVSGMMRGAMLAPISFASVPSAKRAAADSNIRMSRYFVLIAEDSWDAPPASFLHDYKLALACQVDLELPLREVVVMFRRPSHDEATDGRLTAFRNSLDPGVRQFDFSGVAEFKTQIAALFRAWMESSP